MTNNSAAFMLWQTAWCPHCRSMKPAWEEIKEKYDGKNINGTKLEFIEIDCTTETDETSASMNKYNVEGFPTIKLVKLDGTVVDFEAKPTNDSLDQFINSVL